jgi:hypothetical protein
LSVIGRHPVTVMDTRSMGGGIIDMMDVAGSFRTRVQSLVSAQDEPEVTL